MRMNENEARSYVERMGANWDDSSNYVRYCYCCGSWVCVDDYNGDIDKCDNC